MKRISLVCLVLAAILWIAPSHSQERPVVATAVPIGTIVAWHPPGKQATPPAGWQLCDGSRIRDPRFTRRFGVERYTPNLNGAAKPQSKRNAGQQTYLRGSLRSLADGYAGSNQPPSHSHQLQHTHGLSHAHRISLRTTRTGRFGGGAKAGGTRNTSGRHHHDLRGRSEWAIGATQGPSVPRSGPTKQSIEPRHFDVIYLM